MNTDNSDTLSQERTYALRAWTGPTLVKDIAARLTDAGIHVSCAGTEHVWVNATGLTPGGAAHNVCAALIFSYKTDFGLKFRRV